MATIALLPDDQKSRGEYLSNTTLPANYMSDFTMMGFVVDRYQAACELLESAGFNLARREVGADISIDSRQMLAEINSLMTASDLHFQFTDIADTLYQA